jgi:PAS domain S-box-containing protein
MPTEPRTSDDTPAAAPAGAGAPPDRPVVLVVDDDLALLFLAREALEQDGFTVEETADGIQAITVFERVRPDLVLLDVNLPGADGFSVCATLRGTPEGANVPIVMMTAPDDVRAIHRAYEVGATDFITKPLLWTLLGYRLRYVLRSSRTAEYLRSSRARLAQAQSIARVGDGELDLTTQTMDWSDEALRILGLPPHPSRVPLTECWSCVHPADRDAVAEVLVAVSASTAPEGRDFRVLLPGGEERVVHVVVEAIADDGSGPRRATATVHDVTERVRSEARLRQGQRLEAMGRLSAGVAHDFNNLLTVIIGHSELLLLRTSGSDPVRRELELIRNTGRQAGTLTGQLLAFSRGQVLRREALDLNAVVTGMKPLTRRLVGEHITPVFEPDPEVGLVHADRAQIEQILLNLLVNARDAMPKGGRVIIRTANVDLDPDFARRNPGARPGSYVAFSVTDEGVGIEPAVQARLFEPFFTTKGNKGTGLGLATVFGIVKQHEGYITVESTPGHGSRFTVYLGRVEATHAVAAPAAAMPARAPSRAATVLLAEDDRQVRGLLRGILEHGGYTILEACHGTQALELAQAHRGPIDLLVTDVLMPELGGVELARTLTASRPDLKVLFISGYTDDMLRSQGLVASETAFLAKPFTPEALLTSVGQVLPRQT